jgi:hypothetical protein
MCLLIVEKIRTVVGVRARATSHHRRHGLAAVGTHWRGRESRTERLAALSEVLDGAVDLCGGVLALVPILLGSVIAMFCRIAHSAWRQQPQRPAIEDYDIPSNWLAKALAASLLTVELEPASI